LFRLGRFIAYIPAPVITGFTAGIALIILVGQVDNFLGVKTPGAESTALKILGYFRSGFAPDWRVVFMGALVILTMIFWPLKWGKYLPGSLVGIVLATVVTVLTGWDIPTIGSIPRSIILDARLTPAHIPWENIPDFIAPAVSIAALGAVESLLCGAVAAKMTGIRLHANQELIAQGLGNLLIPFFGGVPATAAIARTSVGIKSGGQTRMVSIVHINRVARLNITIQKVDPEKMRARGFDIRGNCPHVEVAYLAGPLFFAATGMFNETFAHREDVHVLILSMRAVPLIDLSGLEALTGLLEKMGHKNQVLMLSGVQPGVLEMLKRAGLYGTIGEEHIFWSSEQAIVEAENRYPCPYCAVE
ncbi:MAG TPA: SulP family inorganic anion transporter, partial [Anaerolineales bacterium]|nr:SulP family inorganic anion transporter [Anaerolineales bacterium]